MTAGFFRHSGTRLLARARNDGGLQETLRIDIDLELKIALGLRPRSEPFAQVVRQVDIAQRLHQQAKAVAALDHGERRLGRAQYLNALVERRDGGELACKT